MPEPDSGERPDPRKEDVMAGDRRLSRPDSALPDWFFPDASYRPIPIAWFAGALVLQVIAMPIVFAVTMNWHGLATIAASLLVSALIGHLAWERGMAEAPPAWRIGTLAMLGFFFAINCIAAVERL